MPTHTAADRLARMPRDPSASRRRTRATEERRRAYDDEGHELFALLPAPRFLAREWALYYLGETVGAEMMNAAGILAARERGNLDAVPVAVNRDKLAARLAEGLATLPDRSDASIYYNGIRRFAQRDTRERLDAYACEVTDALVDVAARWTAPREERQRPAPKTDAERKAAERERERETSLEASDFWTRRHYLDPVEGIAPPEGGRVGASELHAIALDNLAETIEAYDDGTLDDDELTEWMSEEGLAPLVPLLARYWHERDLIGPRHFIEGASRSLGAPRRDKHGAHFRIPPATERDQDLTSYLTPEERANAERMLDLVVDKIASDYATKLAVLVAQRERLAAQREATGTDGATPVVSLADRRRA